MIQKKILVPVNFDAQSESALNYAGILARSMEGMITCLHIIENTRYLNRKPFTNESTRQIRREAEQNLAAQVNSIFVDKTIPFEIIVSEGRVAQKIVEKASDLNATLIIMGRSDNLDNTMTTIGSKTSYVIKHTRVPVITVKDNVLNSNGQILLPLDLSKPLYSIVSKTIEVARLLDSFVNVVAILSYDMPSREIKYKTILSNIQEKFIGSGISCYTKLLISRKTRAEEITKYASNMDIEMILMMDQQEKNVIDLLPGLTTREVIQKSDLPVMIIFPDVLDQELPPGPVLAGSKNPF